MTVLVASRDVLAQTRPQSRVLGLYVHVPFCAQRCHYCSFATAPLDDGADVRRYLGALEREIELVGALEWAPRVTLATVFFGGGTPSLLESDDLAELLDSIRRRFPLTDGAEVTVECNPESVSRAKLAAYRAAGVNRVSLGVQSLDDRILGRLGRLHDARGARGAFEAAHAAGFDNVSVDLMYGLPGLAIDQWARTVGDVLDWAPDHLSAYALTLDGGSAWTATTAPPLPAEDEIVAQYWALARAAEARGLEHYEISNYARPGARARHNLVYWRAAEYLALGPAACGFVGDVRYGNARALARYCAALEDDRLPVETWERLTARQRLAERLILGLRTSDGVDAVSLEARVADDPALRRRVETWREAGWLAPLGGRVALTEAGFLVSDALFVELL